MSEHWPERIFKRMRGRNVLTIALDLIGGVRGVKDLTMSDCAESMAILEWYMENWHPSECPFDAGVFQCIKAAHAAAEDWFRQQASDMGL